ncbi:hypothetical protein DM02DRAFT_366021 [Periconia macrospinosa]|uniref:Uncharacterized protein n=1 Tax=Periconia macrospinosa TaxID=97972 RepID=A0A2V1CZP3_9PLEO|nr:hypothetical protein DM02DRAFT_366021 [Periconia macrospinosa]
MTLAAGLWDIPKRLAMQRTAKKCSRHLSLWLDIIVLCTRASIGSRQKYKHNDDSVSDETYFYYEGGLSRIRRVGIRGLIFRIGMITGVWEASQQGM